MSTDDPVFRQLRNEAIEMMHLDANNLSMLEALQVDLVVSVRTEIDSILAQSGEIDIERLEKAVKIWKSLQPAPLTPQQQQPDWVEAKEGLKNLMAMRASAISARDARESVILQEKIVALEAEVNRLRSIRAEPPAPKRVKAPDVPPAPEVPRPTTTQLYFERGGGGYAGDGPVVGGLPPGWRSDR